MVICSRGHGFEPLQDQRLSHFPSVGQEGIASRDIETVFKRTTFKPLYTHFSTYMYKAGSDHSLKNS